MSDYQIGRETECGRRVEARSMWKAERAKNVGRTFYLQVGHTSTSTSISMFSAVTGYRTLENQAEHVSPY